MPVTPTDWGALPAPGHAARRGLIPAPQASGHLGNGIQVLFQAYLLLEHEP